MTTQLNFKLTDEAVQDLIENAGYFIDYWCQSADEQEDGTWVYTVGDGGDDMAGQQFTLDQAAVDRGVGVLIKQYKAIFAQIVGAQDDAATADCFVQACLFGDILFG